MKTHKLWINGRWQDSSDQKEIRSPFSNELVAQACYATKEQMNEAIKAAAEAFKGFRQVSRATRSALLLEMAKLVSARRAEIAECISKEAGKPITLADAEVGRCLVTLTFAAEEAKRFGGEVVPIDIDAGGRAYAPAVSYWCPRGPVLGITPFNFPLNLVAHKIAPALAAGCSILIKAAPQAPGPALLLAEIFEKAAATVSDSRDSIPLSTVQVLSAVNDVAELAVTDARLNTVSFTGSTKVGWWLQSKAIGKKLALELGGNAAVLVHEDADLKRAAARVAFGANAYAGQSCISVQRVFAHSKVIKEFERLLQEETAKLVLGDPAKKETVVGPVIDAQASVRIESWLQDAVKAGARLLCGGKRQKNLVEPTVVVATQKGQLAKLPVACEEVFGPVMVLDTYETFDEGLKLINDSRFGLQAGLFTNRADLIAKAVQELDVGGVIVNEVPTYRADQMPYGGVKDSGLGREGLRYAMEEYSERKVVVQWLG